MAGELFPSSGPWVGNASGLLTPTIYTPATNTNSAGSIEGVAVVQSLGSTVSAVYQFNLPPAAAMPTGTFKCRHLAWANATMGNAVITLNDGQTNVGSNIGATTLAAETQYTKTWATADIIVEQKTPLTTVPTGNYIFTLRVDFIGAGAVWTLAAQSVHQFSLLWE
jgi:hypothetical protein